MGILANRHEAVAALLSATWSHVATLGMSPEEA
jgi:hypothetical protein